jgi:dihydrofolate reductase
VPKLIWHTTLSLDGFIAGPDDAMEWVFEQSWPSPDPVFDEIIATTGALLVGRNSYDVGFKEGQVEEATEPFGGAWSGPQFVLTHRPPEHPLDPSVTFVEGDVGEAADTALAAAGGKNVLVFGATTARQCIEAGRLDEILVHVVPVLLGDGIRLYGDPPGPRVDLELIAAEQHGEQIANLRYRVSRA